MHYSSRIAAVFAIILTSCLALGSGCDSGSASQTAPKDGQAKGGLPNFQFHQPKKLEVALTRIRELHDAMLAEAPLPDPSVFKVVELIHGTGSAAHSHYHLADESYDGHREEDEKQKVHDYKVDAVQELTDLIGWLPRIAGKSDLSEKDWDRLRDISRAFDDKLETAFAEAKDADEKREAYKSVSDEASGYVDSIEKLVTRGLSKNDG